jgi:hypothetical protein
MSQKPPAGAVEIGGHAGQKDEERRAVVGDPAGQKQRRIGHVARIHPAWAEKVARVVERHQNHDAAAQQVDGIDARARGRLGHRHAGPGAG